MSKIVVLAFLMTVALANATSAQAQDGRKPVGTGDMAPDFSLMDHRGQKVTLSDFKDKNPVVLVFYRGYW
jgi:cytochrome oxidase Cu insertion factor (SCO1/SenC/PrrC family)